jgi:uncharacterized RDD family membrane protein YckC
MQNAEVNNLGGRQEQPPTRTMLDDELVVETPERVELYFILASVGNRFLAAAIDHIIQIILVVGIILAFGWAAGWSRASSLGVWAAALMVLAFFAIYFGYFVFFETIWSGQTPGKRIMKLRVIREDGRPVRFFEVFVRNLLRLFIDFMPLPSYAVGVVSIIFSSRSKRIGDFVAGTVVIKERSSEAPSLEEITRALELELARSGPSTAVLKTDASLLEPGEVRAIQAFLRRRFELSAESRASLAVRIAGPVAARLGIVDPKLSAEAFLEEIDRQHKAHSRYSS